MMSRYYLEVRYRVTPVEAVDEHTDAMMDALSVESNLIDADVGADLRHGWVDVCAVVEGEDEASALRTGLVAIRSAAHHADTPGWEADLGKLMVTVRPAEFADTNLLTQSPGYPEPGGTVTVRPRAPVHDDSTASASGSVRP